MSVGGTRAIDALRAAGVAFTVHEYEPGRAEPGRGSGGSDHRPAYGQQAAVALGVDPGRILKTLVAAVDGRLAVAVVPVASELDLKKLASALQGRRAVMAESVAAERATGYVVGGISPLGQRRSLPTVVDTGAAEHETVYVSAGRRGMQVELAPADLVRLTDAVVSPIARH